MTDFLNQQLDYIYFLCGLSLLLLFALCVSNMRRDDERLPFALLGLFGFFQGLNDWLHIIFMSMPNNPLFHEMVLILPVLSLIFLFEFGRRSLRIQNGCSLGAWVYIPLLMLAGTGLFAGLSGFNIYAGYVLGIPGGIISAIVLWREALRMASGPKRALIFISVAMIMFTFLFCVIVPKADFFPASVLNYEVFSLNTGIPIQLIQALCVFLLVIGVWRYKHELWAKSLNTSVLEVHSIEHGVAWIFIAVLIGGWIWTNFTGISRDSEERNNLLIQARIAAKSINVNYVKALTGTSADLKSYPYQRIKEQLSSMRYGNSKCSFLYLMGIKDGNVLFLVDSEPPDSEDYSPPGQIYEDSSDELISTFSTGNDLVEGPLPDEWGVWVSALVPIKDPQSGRVLAVLGSDVDAVDWSMEIASFRLRPIIVTMSFVFLIIGFFFMQQRSRESQLKISSSEQRLRAIFNATYDALILHDVDGCILKFNNTMLEMYGVKFEDANHLTFIDLSAPDNPFERLNDIWSSVMTGESSVFEWRARRVDDGESFDVEVVCRKFNDGDRDVILACVHDITERKKTEDVIAEMKHQFENVLIAASQTAIIATDLKGLITVFNPGAERMLGYKVDEVVGKHTLDFIHLNSEIESHGKELSEELGYSIKDFEVFTSTAKQGKPETREWSYVRKNGEQIIVNMTVTAIKNRQRELTGYLCVAQDVTEQKRAEEEIAEHIAQLARLNDELQERNKELDEFTYVASHDLQEPLRKLTAFAGLLTKDVDETSLPENARKDLSYIADAATRMQILVKDLLALSRSGRAAMNREEISLDECVDEALNALETRIEETRAEIKRDTLPRIWGDRRMLTQLYQNLIGNALKFVKGGPPLVRITAEKVNDEWVFGVQDDGIGINPSYMEQIFVPFKRLHNQTEYEGSGIGLAICKKVVERHDGKIWVESELGKGAHFKFTIPARTRKRSQDE